MKRILPLNLESESSARFSTLLSLFLTVSVSISVDFSAKQAEAEISRAFERQFWTGTFRQTSPLAWTGPMELSIRFDSDESPPQMVEGVLYWKTLGEARIRVSGTRQPDGSLEFRETECLEGDCDQIILGGSHRLRPIENGNQLSGSASGAFGLQGTYTLSRVREPL